MSEESRLISAARELTGSEVLVIDTDPSVQRGMVQLLAPAGLQVTAAVTPDKALELVGNKFFGVVIVDLDTPTPGAGQALIKAVRELSPISLVFVLSPRKSFDAAVTAFRAGAHDVIMKAPDQVEYLKARIIDGVGDATTRRGTETLLAETRDALEDFLKRFMEAERRALDLDDKLHGRDPMRTDIDEEVRLLFVDADDRLYQAIVRALGKGFSASYAQSGGQALDRVTNSTFHIALVGEMLPDLPGTMVIRALKAQSPDLIVISYAPNGKLEIVETTKTIPIVDKFTSATQLTSRLGELAEAHQAKGRERRYLQAFRERHYEFLRRLSELRRKLEKAIEDGKDTFEMK